MLSRADLGYTVTVGEILAEIVATTVGTGFVEAQTFIGPFPSGAPAIFIDQCGKIGCPSAVIGTVGHDDFGKANLERLREDGVDLSAVTVDPDYPTGTAFVRYRPDGNRDFLYNIGYSAAARMGWSDEVDHILAGSGHLHIVGSALTIPGAADIINKAARIVKGRGGSVSLDPNLRKELRLAPDIEALFDELVDLSDLLLPSGEELERTAKVNGEEKAIQYLFERGVGEIALKRGAGGATVFLPDGTRHEAPKFKVEEVDPTGAGDCFGGAYVACRRLGCGIDEALSFASAAGARNVTRRGPMEGAGTKQELEQFIAGATKR